VQETPIGIGGLEERRMATNAIKLYQYNATDKRVSINYDADKEAIPSQALVVNGSILIRGKNKNNDERDAAIIFTPYAVTSVANTNYSPGSIVFKEDNNLSRFAFYQYSRTSTNGTTYNNHYDAFYLPDTSAGKSTSDVYKILTTKSVTLSPAELTRVQSMLGITPVDTSVFVQLSGAQTITGKKLFQNDATYPGIRISGSNVTNYGSATYGPAYLGLNFGSSSNPFFRIEFTEYSHRTGNVNTFLSAAEVYHLPEVTPGLSGNNKPYLILTEKTPVTVAQGGTGATTAAGARTALGLGSSATYAASTAATGSTVALRNSNGDITGRYLTGAWLQTTDATAQTTPTKIATLGTDNFIYYATPADVLKAGGIGVTSLYNGTFTSGSATLTNGVTYNVLVIVAKISTSDSSYITTTIPVAHIGTSATQYQVADNNAYNSFSFTKSGNNLTMAKVNTNGAIYSVYGIN